MIKSMTGYGRGEVEDGGQKWVVELKSVNHRFLDLSLNIPRHLWALEERIRKVIKGRLARGRVELQLTWEGRGERPVTLRLDPVLTSEVKGLLAELGAYLPRAEPLRLEHFLQFADLIVARERQVPEVEEIWDYVARALAQALDRLEVMRSNEGAALADELLGQLELLRRELERIRTQADLVPRLWQDRLTQRLAELKGEIPLDETRLAQEVALLAERRDIREELARLESHVGQFQEALAGTGPVGRKLDFLLQEMNREANTIGVKAGDLEISQAVLELKGLVERLREQVQNVE